LRSYPVKFVQQDGCFDDSDHVYTRIYTFISETNKLKYVIRAEYFKTDTYALKFYPKRWKKRDNRYSIIINAGDAANILYTVGSLIPELLKASPKTSIALSATRSIDSATNRLEPIELNQRY